MSHVPGGTTSKVTPPSKAEREATESLEILRPLVDRMEGSVMATLQGLQTYA